MGTTYFTGEGIVTRRWHAADLCEWLGVPTPATSFSFEKFSIDSRKIKSGEVFIALKGEQFDGHDYIAQAVANGAVAIIADKSVTNEVVTTSSLDTTIPVIYVQNTLEGLNNIARAMRRMYSPKTIAVTGSCGKTTTKTMIATILQLAGHTLWSEGNLNNHVGLPLSLLRLDDSYEYAVFELGANHVGEISQLTALAKPDVAVLTCAQAVHLEGFGSVENIAKAKGEIFEGLPKDGTAVINADDQFADYWRNLIAPTQHIKTFGLHQPAEIYAEAITFNELAQPRFMLVSQKHRLPIELGLMGEHNIANALAAAAACLALGIAPEIVQQGLANTAPVSGRLVRKQGLNGSLLIDDSYNANPHALRAALSVLAANPKHKVLVLGDMLELGPDAEKWHFEAGKMALEAGVKKLYALGPLSAHAVKAFGEDGSHYQTHEGLADALKRELSPETAVLFKASRGMKLEKIIQAVIAEAGK